MLRVIPFLTELTRVYEGNINPSQNKNKQDSECTITQRWDAFVQPLLHWKTISITYSKSVFAALGIQHAMRMRHIVICGLSGSVIIFHIIL